MSKLTQYNTTDGGRENPCELVSAFMLWERDGGTLYSWLEQFDFDTREEIEKAIRLFIRTKSTWRKRTRTPQPCLPATLKL